MNWSRCLVKVRQFEGRSPSCPAEMMIIEAFLKRIFKALAFCHLFLATYNHFWRESDASNQGTSPLLATKEMADRSIVIWSHLLSQPVRLLETEMLAS